MDSWAGPWGYVDSPPFGALSPSELAVSPYPVGEPTSVPELSERWIACREGNGGACDDLAVQAALTSDPLILQAYIDFGTTCGGRVVDTTDTCVALLGGERSMEGFGRIVRAHEALPLLGTTSDFDLRKIPGPTTPPPGADAAWDRLWSDCGEGRSSGCIELADAIDVVWESPKQDYFFFAQSCGGRTSIEITCTLLLAPRDDRVSPGSPPPGLNNFLGGAFAEDPDDAWIACAEADYRQCLALALEFSTVGDPDDERWPYRLFGVSCGGLFTKPVTAVQCLSYIDWPTIEDLDELPGPREFS